MTCGATSFYAWLTLFFSVWSSELPYFFHWPAILITQHICFISHLSTRKAKCERGEIGRANSVWAQGCGPKKKSRCFVDESAGPRQKGVPARAKAFFFFVGVVSRHWPCVKLYASEPSRRKLALVCHNCRLARTWVDHEHTVPVRRGNATYGPSRTKYSTPGQTRCCSNVLCNPLKSETHPARTHKSHTVSPPCLKFQKYSPSAISSHFLSLPGSHDLTKSDTALFIP